MVPSDKTGWTKVINARGTFTPLGVSRSPAKVREAVAEALRDYVRIEEMQQAASESLARFSGVEAGHIVHCAAAAVTLTVAACMTKGEPQSVARLPDAHGLPCRVLLPAGHNVNYGHAIEQAIRLAGGKPQLIGAAERCDISDLQSAMLQDDICGLLLVSSRLSRGSLDLAAAVDAARRQDVPVIIDGAAQDMRVRELAQTGADLIILSGQKYLCGPTAGLVVGTTAAMAAVRAQEVGIGRGMKASKEAIAGTLAALEVREELSIIDWRAAQSAKLQRFLQEAATLTAVTACAEPDPTGLPFARAVLEFDPPYDAEKLAEQLQASTPPIYVMTHLIRFNKIALEINALRQDELHSILLRLRVLLADKV